MRKLHQYPHLDRECSSLMGAAQIAGKRFEWIFDGEPFTIEHLQTTNQYVIFSAISGERRESTCVYRKVLTRTFIPCHKYDHMSVADAQDFRFQQHEKEISRNPEIKDIALSHYEEHTRIKGIRGYMVRSTLRFIHNTY